MRLRKYFRIAFFVLLLNALIFVSASPAFIGIKTGDAPENIKLQDITGKAVNISQSVGSKPVILVFWKLTDEKKFQNFSLDELRFLSRFYDNYHETYGLEIYGVYKPMTDNGVSEIERAHVKRVIDENKIEFPILIDSGGKIYQDYGVIVLPSTVMINGEGKISFLYPGFPLTSASVLTEQINNLVGVIKVVQKKGLQ